MDNVFTLEIKSRSLHSNIKTNNTKLEPQNVYSSMLCVRIKRRQHIRVQRPLN